MSQNSPTRSRWSAPKPQAPFAVALSVLKNRSHWNRVTVCLLASTILWLATGGWVPSFPYRERIAPTRNMHSRVEFKYADPIETVRARQRARRNVLTFYQNDQHAIEQTREALVDRVFHLITSPIEEVDRKVWAEFIDGVETNTTEKAPEEPDDTGLQQFRDALTNDESLTAFQVALTAALRPIEENGLLEKLEHELGEGSTLEILVHPLNNSEVSHRVDVATVRMGEAKDALHRRLTEVFKVESETVSDPTLVANRVYKWLEFRIKPSLKLNKELTEIALKNAEDAVETTMKTFLHGDSLERPDLLAAKVTRIKARTPLTYDDILLLKAEHTAFVTQMTFGQRIVHSMAHLGMYVGMFSLLAGYLYYRERPLVDDLQVFALLIGLVSATVLIAWLVSLNASWRGEIIPVVVFAMAIAIAINREMAMLLSGIVSMIFSVGHGYGITEFVILTGTAVTASLLCGRIRSRPRLFYVGLLAAAVAFPTTIGISLMNGQPFTQSLLVEALMFAAGALLASVIMSALLPFLEKWFGVETDISLLELSDANHPLLRQLVQRAPGTYNHSINVASIAEAAADSIGANGLLCRVGAYFHDIGKMRKPDYFIENQSGNNKHDDLVPTMSTLVIIAHVKEGAEMARKHHLPDRIIDLIEQHHGTTLVEYFYRQATEKNDKLAEPVELEEANFRYPGPKPQTPESAVLMLADTVESASRSLREPTPSRIEHLVTGILKKKLDDGQFDECSVTLKQLHTIQDQLIKSLNAMYHARVKYPGQQPA